MSLKYEKKDVYSALSEEEVQISKKTIIKIDCDAEY